MRDITVRCAELAEKVLTNRARHRTKFLKAQEAFRARLIEELDRRLADARNGLSVNLYIDLPEPKDHTADYDRVLEMLAMHIEENIDLSERDVQMYVQDDWGWKKEFETTNLVYAVE